MRRAELLLLHEEQEIAANRGPVLDRLMDGDHLEEAREHGRDHRERAIHEIPGGTRHREAKRAAHRTIVDPRFDSIVSTDPARHPDHPARSVRGARHRGDVILTGLGSYLTIRKSRTGFSAHLFFDLDCGAYRWIVRVGGLPLWENAVTPPHSTVTRSSIVTLENR